jgi:hypothetical protein
MATKIEQQITFNDWARKFNVSTLWDNERSENREFLKKLDAARPVYHELKRNKQNGNI